MGRPLQRAQKIVERPDTRDYRVARRQDTREGLAGVWRRHGLSTSLMLAVLGGTAYAVWGAARDVSVDPIGLLIAAVAPPVVVVGGAWVYFRVKGPARVYQPLRQYYDEHNPPAAWTTGGRVKTDGVTLQLMVATSRHSSTTVPLASAAVHVIVNDHHVKGPVFGPTDLSVDSPLRVSYPQDFVDASWPLQRGTYNAVWNVEGADGTTRITGWQIRIRR